MCRKHDHVGPCVSLKTMVALEGSHTGWGRGHGGACVAGRPLAAENRLERATGCGRENRDRQDQVMLVRFQVVAAGWRGARRDLRRVMREKGECAGTGGDWVLPEKEGAVRVEASSRPSSGDVR